MTRRLQLGFILAILSLSVNAQDPGLTFGGADNEAGYSLCVTGDEGYLLAGSTRSLGAGSWDMYAVKLTREGTMEWSKTYGWQHHDHFQSVIQLGDGYLFTGYAWDYGDGREDVYLLKTDLSGNRIFDHLYGTPLLDMGFRVRPLASGGYIIVGYSRGYEPHGDILLIRTDEQGNEIWRNHYGTDYDDYAYSLAEMADGSLMILGSTGSFHDDVHYNFQRQSADWLLIRTDSEGTETWRKEFPAEGHDFAREIIAHPDNGFYLFGSTMSTGAGSFDMHLVKIDESGNETWSKTFGGVEYEYGMSMDINTAGDIYLLGSSKSYGQQGTPDCYLVKTDAQGNELWDLTIGGSHPDYGMQVAVTPDQGCALIGKTMSFGAGGFDMMIAKVSADGMIEQLISGIDTSENEQAVIYPNPLVNAGRFRPDDHTVEYRMDLVSLSGIKVLSQVLRPPDYRFTVETLPSGLYFYRIRGGVSENYTFSGKLLVR